MNLLDEIEDGEKNAPSYFLVPLGSSFKCPKCGVRDTRQFIKYFTPDGTAHSLAHLACMDQGWIEQAKNMGEL